MLSRHTPAQRGFTLLETLVALAIAAILASLSYPAFAEQIRKARRGDALVRLAQLQLVQERWRSEHAGYASLAELAVPAETADGLYRLSIAEPQAAGYVALAEARGAQGRDGPCRFLQLRVAGGNAVRSSGADAGVTNGAALNDRCWNR